MVLARAAVVLGVAALVAAAGGSASVKHSALAAPSPVAPAGGATVQALPAFGWRAVGGADHYEFQIGADPSFNSPVIGRGHDSIATHNTWAALTEGVPNGTYWWHVRAVTKSGAVSGWSGLRMVRKRWTSVPRLVAPANGEQIFFPATPLVLRWTPVPYAAKYLVSLATDRDLGTLLGRKPIETEGLSYAPPITLADKHTYYWGVVPVDAHGNRGVPSRVGSFTWRWRSETTPKITDLVAAQEQYDPQLSWKPVPGAARYEIEINPAKEWTPGSKVCCDDPVVATTFSPPDLLPNNRYYYRVRAINVSGNAGHWVPGGEGTSEFSFTKTFDNLGEETASTIKNLRVLDNYGHATTGAVTSTPVVTWDPVPGASKYEIFVTGAPRCGGSRNNEAHALTAVPAWTPLASGGTAPYPVPHVRVSEERQLCPGQYDVRVRAYTDKGIDHKDIFGNFTSSPGAFTVPEDNAQACTGASRLSPSADRYLAPAGGAVERWTPLFRWQAVPNALSYWVIVSKDQSFTTIVDYAFTRNLAYAPRENTSPRTYTDEETRYYWAILPSPCKNGARAPEDPNLVVSADFQKRSTPPAILEPNADGRRVLGPPTFRWTPVLGAKYYRLQVSTDRNFGTLLDDVKTHSTAYTATQTYPSNAALYVRVRAVDEEEVGLTWSTLRPFRNTLTTPIPGRDNPTGGDLLPTWTWLPIQGGVSYDLHAELPNGTTRDFSNLIPTAFTPVEMRGTGVFHWQVRAEFSEAGGRKTAVGPYTRRMSFTRTIQPPTGAHAVAGGRSVLILWQPKIGADHYRVEVSHAPDFGRLVDRDDTEGTSWAPDLRRSGWSSGGIYYWRVRAIDGSNNAGRPSPVKSFRLHGTGPGVKIRPKIDFPFAPKR